MPLFSTEILEALQRRPDTVRNISIAAHVDCGKTTLCDTLVASNGIISARLAGEVRYMDSLPEEQQRGITMKASAITVVHGYSAPGAAAGDTPVPYLINVVDTVRGCSPARRSRAFGAPVPPRMHRPAAYTAHGSRCGLV